ncbi:MAG: NTP transferase domain-containing protein [Armatimonadota bacterium]
MPSSSVPLVVIAAAGQSKRFASQQKVLAEVGGRPAICRVADTCAQALGPHEQVIVIGHQGAQVRAVLGEAPYRSYVIQEPQLGTGHALSAALANLEPVPDREVFLLCGDRPLLTADSLRRLRQERQASGAAMVFLVGKLRGDALESRQGRVVQAHRGTPRAEVLAIVERPTVDALDGRRLAFESLTGERYEFSREQLLAVREVNLSAYVWPESVLRANLGKLAVHPEKGEYFVTDLVEVLRQQRLLVRLVAASADGERIGIDTPEQLRAAQQEWRRWQESPPVRAPASGIAEEASDALL